jgi:hypothetical protein
MRPRVVALAAGLVLAAVMSYPTIVHPASMARIDSDDGRFSVWNVAWVAHALLDDPAHLYDANIFYPHTGTLAYSEANLVAGVLAVPAYAITRNPVAAHNVAVYEALVLAFLAMWALVRRLTGSWPAALTSATAFAFAPYVSSWTTEVQLLMVFVFPVALLALHAFVDRPGPLRGVVLGLALALAGLACGYYGIYAGLAVGLGVLWFAPRQRSQPRYWTGVLLAVVVAGATVAPAFAPYLALRDEAGMRRSVNTDELRSYSADPGAYLTSPAIAHRWLAGLVGHRSDAVFPGMVVVLLAGAGIWRAGRGGLKAGPPGPSPGRVIAYYGTLAGLACWASFGPQAGLYAWLVRLVPFMSFLRAPVRFGVVVVFGLAVVAGFGAAALMTGRRRGVLAAALVLLTGADVKAVWPLVRVPPVPAVYRYLATLPRGGVVEFHFPYQPSDLHRHARYMFWSAWHWQPLINGYSDYLPPDFRQMAVPINGFPDPVSFRILRAHRARYVVLHLGEESYNAAARATLLARLPPYAADLRLLFEAQDDRVYEIVGWPD